MAVTNGTVTKYVYGLGLIGEEKNGSFVTYHFDLRGSTVAITNANGTVTDTFGYDTYGRMTARTGNTQTAFLYNGRDGVMTEDNGLIYMRARYYSPVLRRFINADKVHGDISNAVTLNRYAFANCNPVANVDPLGLSVEHGNINSRNTEDDSAWDKFKTRDGNYALYDNWRYRKDGVFHEQAFVVSFRQPKFGVAGSSEGWIVLAGGDDSWINKSMASGVVVFDLLKGGWEFGDLSIDMLDVVHAELGVEFNSTKIECQAFASLWSPSVSPSVSYDFGGFSVDLSAEVCSVGFGFKFSADGFKISVPGIFGFSIGVTY